jgi:sugar lactone lactonase YvrE
MRFTLLTALLLLSGCATAPADFHAYGGTRKPSSETARITTDSQLEHKVLVGLDDRIYVTAVDGRATEGNAWEKYPRTVYVLPGSRKLDMVWGNGFVIANGCLTLPTEAGHNYIIRQDVRDKKVYLWAEDQATSQSVTGTAKDASLCGGDG